MTVFESALRAQKLLYAGTSPLAIEVYHRVVVSLEGKTNHLELRGLTWIKRGMFFGVVLEGVSLCGQAGDCLQASAPRRSRGFGTSSCSSQLQHTQPASSPSQALMF